MAASRERQFEPEEVKSRENRPEAGNLNLRELLQMLERNPYYEDLEITLRAQRFNLDEVRAIFKRRAGLAARCLELIELGDSDDDRRADELAYLKQQLRHEGLLELNSEPEVEDLKRQRDALEQVVNWAEGLTEVATTKVEVLPPEGQVSRELEELALAGNVLAATARQQWEGSLRYGIKLPELVRHMREDFDRYFKEATDKGDGATATRVWEVLQVLERWFP